MKILTITSHISSNALPCFQRNKTGFGYMVNDIITALAKIEDVDVLVYYYRFKELFLGNARYIGQSLGNIILNLSSCLPFSCLFTHLRKYPVSKGTAARIVYCWLLTGYYSNVIKKKKYDVVHIHGCSVCNEMWVQMCSRLNQKYVVTLHGLNSFSDSIRISESEKRYERDFLHDTVLGKHNITVIATGIKNKIIENEDVAQSDFISVICNSFKFEETYVAPIDIHLTYGIPQGSKIILYVGNVSFNKNQVQMARSFDLMNEHICQQTYVLFIGNPEKDNTKLADAIAKSRYKEHLICCGGIEKALMPFYYKEADGVVLLSWTEGFGLSLAEGMHFGVPCATFTDLDAFDDLYMEKAMIAIPSRRDEDVALSVEKLLITKWDSDAIRSYSQKFISEMMAKKYLQVFHRIVDKV